MPENLIKMWSVRLVAGRATLGSVVNSRFPVGWTVRQESSFFRTMSGRIPPAEMLDRQKTPRSPSGQR